MDVRGADQLARLSKALKDAANQDPWHAKSLRSQLTKGITGAMKPVRQAVKESARETLPSKGGLNQRVARVQLRTQRSASARRSGVRLIAVSKSGMKRLQELDKGTIRHPVFGNREVWVTQAVRPGFWTKPTEEFGPKAREEILKAMAEVAQQIGQAP